MIHAASATRIATGYRKQVAPSRPGRRHQSDRADDRCSAGARARARARARTQARARARGRGRGRARKRGRGRAGASAGAHASAHASAGAGTVLISRGTDAWRRVTVARDVARLNVCSGSQQQPSFWPQALRATPPRPPHPVLKRRPRWPPPSMRHPRALLLARARKARLAILGALTRTTPTTRNRSIRPTHAGPVAGSTGTMGSK
jgi:hypothetical protein